MTDPDTLRWHVAWTTWRAENRAKANLEQKGYTVLVPTRMVEIRHAGRKQLVERPIFPRYLFVGVPDDGSWYPIISTVAVAGLLSNGGKPVVMPQWIMRNLIEAQDAGAFSKPAHVDPLHEGQDVKFVGGPLEGFVGKIMSASPGRRVSVLVEMFGHKKEFNVPLANLRAA